MAGVSWCQRELGTTSLMSVRHQCRSTRSMRRPIINPTRCRRRQRPRMLTMTTSQPPGQFSQSPQPINTRSRVAIPSSSSKTERRLGSSRAFRTSPALNATQGRRLYLGVAEPSPDQAKSNALVDRFYDKSVPKSLRLCQARPDAASSTGSWNEDEVTRPD